MTEDQKAAVVRAELRRAAFRHEPDRTVMLNRIAAGRGARRTPRARGVRLAGSALAVATVLGIGGVARWALAGEQSPAPVAVAPPPVTRPVTPSPSRSSAPSKRPPAAPPSSAGTSSVAPAASTRTAAPPEVRGHPGDTQAEKGSLWSDGSIDPASTGIAGQSAVTLKAGADLTELDLTIRVVLTPGLADQDTAGGVATAGITTTVERQDGALLFRFVLRDGATLPGGTYVLTARYTHDNGSRNAGDDTYEAFATDADHKRIHVYGNFYSAKK
jgi:hypothetical protein